MPVEVSIFLLVALIFCGIFYFSAGIIYDFHYKLKADDNPLSKVVSFDVKYLDDKAKWVKRYRIKLFLFLGLIVSILFFIIYPYLKHGV